VCSSDLDPTSKKFRHSTRIRETGRSERTFFTESLR